MHEQRLWGRPKLPNGEKYPAMGWERPWFHFAVTLPVFGWIIANYGPSNNIYVSMLL
jgi:hypothetical protein